MPADPRPPVSRYAPLTQEAVRALWRQHGPAPDTPGAAPEPPWPFLVALFAAWRDADETRQAVVMGWATPGSVDALRRGEGPCLVHPTRTKRLGAKAPVGVLYLTPAPAAGADHAPPEDRAA